MAWYFGKIGRSCSLVDSLDKGSARRVAHSDISPLPPQEKQSDVVCDWADLEEQDQRLRGGGGDIKARKGRTFQYAGFSDRGGFEMGKMKKDNDTHQPHVWTVAAALKLEF